MATTLHHNVRDLTGREFGRWRVVSYAGKSYWNCRCRCGTEKPVFTGNLVGDKSLSCGCHRDELASAKNGTHRLSGTAEYKVWAGIKRRCFNTNDGSYAAYGGSGVIMSPRWASSFEAFLEDMGHRPSSDHTIERIKNQLGYAPGNCRWATRAEQNRNKRNNVYLTYDETTMTVSEWAARVGIQRQTIEHRLKHGWTIERALTVPASIGRNQFSE